jgi:hypothetical protein
MKIKKYVMILVCAGAIVLSALSVQISTSYVSNESADVSFTLNDLISVAFADEEDGGTVNCTGSDCDEANGYHYTTFIVGTTVTCCGIASPTGWLGEGKKAS